MNRLSKLMLLGLAAATIGLSQSHDANASVFGWFDNFELTLESKPRDFL